MTTSLDFIIGVTFAAIVIFNIVILRKFLNLCKKVDEINTHILDYENIDAHDVRIAILTGKQDEIYNKIIDRLYITLSLNDGDKSKRSRRFIDGKISVAQSMCNLLGKDLPPQLRSAESYQLFIDSTGIIGDKCI